MSFLLRTLTRVKTKTSRISEGMGVAAPKILPREDPGSHGSSDSIHLEKVYMSGFLSYANPDENDSGLAWKFLGLLHALPCFLHCKVIPNSVMTCCQLVQILIFSLKEKDRRYMPLPLMDAFIGHLHYFHT